MPSTVTPAVPSAPAVGTVIDAGSLQLVDVLGVGGYGVVYKAIPTRFAPKTLNQSAYAVKALVNPTSSRKATHSRNIHAREILLHQHASIHPGVITLHRVVEEGNCTFLIMEYAPSGDLFSQILNQGKYLEDSKLIKDVFLQILAAVDYCHQLGIYHRDLKPENILCFENGARIALVDFGLATTDELSDEGKTGSVYHMSPECQTGSQRAPYSPFYNDIWSLGIILLNLATGRNPWKAALKSDPTFDAYLQDPQRFLPTVLPISSQANALLVRMLDPDYKNRPSVAEIRLAILRIDDFYAGDAIFDDSMARCPWEEGMDIESANSEQVSIVYQPELKSCWSMDSVASSSIVFATQSALEQQEQAPWDDEAAWTSREWSWVDGPDHSPKHAHRHLYESPRTPALSTGSGSIPSMPVTPHDTTFGSRAGLPKGLRVHTERTYYDPSVSATLSSSCSTMQTAIESYNGMSASSFFLAQTEAPSKLSFSTATMSSDVMEMHEGSLWYNMTDPSNPSCYSQSSGSAMACDDAHAAAPSWTRRSEPIDIPPPRHLLNNRSVSFPELYPTAATVVSEQQPPYIHRPIPTKKTPLFQFAFPARSPPTVPLLSAPEPEATTPCFSRTSTHAPSWWHSRAGSPDVGARLANQQESSERGKKGTLLRPPKLWSKLFASSNAVAV